MVKAHEGLPPRSFGETSAAAPEDGGERRAFYRELAADFARTAQGAQ